MFDATTSYMDIMKSAVHRKYQLMRYYYTQMSAVAFGNSTYQTANKLLEGSPYTKQRQQREGPVPSDDAREVPGARTTFNSMTAQHHFHYIENELSSLITLALSIFYANYTLNHSISLSSIKPFFQLYI
jgi:hypothetical protein